MHPCMRFGHAFGLGESAEALENALRSVKTNRFRTTTWAETLKRHDHGPFS